MTFDFQQSKISRPWFTATVEFDSQELGYASKQASLKSKKTMEFSQAGTSRTANLKYQKQLQGILAEMAVKKYLDNLLVSKKLTDWIVERYDDVRTDNFESARNEYDIKIKSKVSSKEYYVESRSSLLSDRSLIEGLKTCHIIGAYNSVAKGSESMADYYVLPLFCFDEKLGTFDEMLTEEYIKQNSLTLRLVAGCTEDMILKRNKINNLGQGGTSYMLLEILKGLDMREFGFLIIDVLSK